MEFEDALHGWVSQQAPMVALIGEPNRLRFFKGKIPQGSKMPSTVQQRSGADRQYRPCRIDGAVAVSMQIDHYAKNWQAMAELARTFRESLDPRVVQFPLLMGPGDSPPTGVRVRGAFIDNEFDADDPDPGLLRRVQLWTFWIVEP